MQCVFCVTLVKTILCVCLWGLSWGHINRAHVARVDKWPQPPAGACLLSCLDQAGCSTDRQRYPADSPTGCMSAPIVSCVLVLRRQRPLSVLHAPCAMTHHVVVTDDHDLQVLHLFKHVTGHLKKRWDVGQKESIIASSDLEGKKSSLFTPLSSCFFFNYYYCYCIIKSQRWQTLPQCAIVIL